MNARKELRTMERDWRATAARTPRTHVHAHAVKRTPNVPAALAHFATACALALTLAQII